MNRFRVCTLVVGIVALASSAFAAHPELTSAGLEQRVDFWKKVYTLYGENGGDLLDSGIGNDILDGGSGNDTIVGGAGNDTMTGGLGDDRFVFAAGQGTAGEADLILDFSRNDRIDLEGLTATVSAGTDDTVLHLSDGSSIVLAGFSGWQSDLLV